MRLKIHSTMDFTWLSIILVTLMISVSDGDVQNYKTLSRSRRSTSHDIFAVDNFISLVEKIEKVQQNKQLKTTVNYIRTLISDHAHKKWTTLLGTQKDYLPNGILTSQEKTTLTNMVNHRFLGQEELGVVNTPYGDVAMSRVITGILASINRNKNIVVHEIYSITADHIDNLFASTIAGDLALAALATKINPSNPLLGPGGTWSPNSECPQSFNLDMPTASKATSAQVLGGIDGFLLGHLLPQWTNKGEIHLGQLLRMYYQKNGKIACQRLSKLNEIMTQNELTKQVTLAMYATKSVWNGKADFSSIKTSDIPNMAKATVQRFYKFAQSLQSGYKCPEINTADNGCLLPTNMLFLLDESGSISPKNYEVEKTFVKNIIEGFDISIRNHTRVGVVEYSDNAKESIRLGEYFSKSTLKCAVENLQYRGGGTATSKALETAQDILLRVQLKADSSPNIVILLTDGKSNGGISSLTPIVNSMKQSITGLTMISVGVDNYKIDELELIATDPTKHVLTSADFGKLISLVKDLRKQTCKTSTIVKTIKTIPPRNDSNEEIDDVSNDNAAVITGTLSPGQSRVFTLLPETLIKTENISIEIKPEFGSVTVYTSRTNDSPGPDDYDLKFTVDSQLRQRRSVSRTKGKAIEFYSVCKGYNETTCPPLFFSVYGDNSTNSCFDFDCTVPSQIKFNIKAGKIPFKPVIQDDNCFFQVSGNKLRDMKEVTIKMKSVNNSRLFISRTSHKPDQNNFDTELPRKDAVNMEQFQIMSIVNPCTNGAKECLPIYMNLKGREVECGGCNKEANCTAPNQIMMTFKMKSLKKVLSPDKMCFHTISSSRLKGAETVTIKIKSKLVREVRARISRTHHAQNGTGMTKYAGNGTENINIRNPCPDNVFCPPMILTFKGFKLSCANCSKDDLNLTHCELPENVTVLFKRGNTHSSGNSVAVFPQTLLVGAVLSFLIRSLDTF